ncbi:M20/M25/M40 family metallo-hydrolase [Iamia majanohamensis]|uniref:M20/M25/M40 family metallo-hydrolase n=1 Tax=Iamia majanohamensis TaxID=467976 RepID=A0AAE9Y9K1_9ACTN|nr:M20/M25/M40 family metallo-hydrolase [Iamia majanohamensis]WCO68311.1 M20/M25/M40 family metallo-hydrolase [Iamia majanohamensis]
MALDTTFVADMVEVSWDDDIVPALHDYIRIPNVSPAYDPGWAEAGHMDRATEMVRAWLAARPIEGLTVEVVQLEGRTPVILAEVPGTDEETDADTVLLYGHLDKQPPMEGWRDGLGPWEPVLDGDHLYGRGGADDGYAAFACLTAIEAVRAAGGAHARCVVLIEASEESGSPDLPAYFDHLAPRLGTPSLVVCLDSSAPDDHRLWLTTSLRGMVQAHLRVDVLREGVHSGLYGGIVPSSFRLLRHLLDRVEDPATGEVVLAELASEVPAERREQAAAAVAAGVDVRDDPPWVAGPVATDPVELVLANTWAASLAVTGLGGAPPPDAAGNVLLAHAEAALCVRLAPRTDPAAAVEALREALTSDPPEGALVDLTVLGAEGGWDAPPTAPWLAAAVEEASQVAFGTPAGALGVGGTIPFMGMLGRRFPDAQFAITGVLVPGSNAHGPNEFLHVPTGKRVTTAVASLLHAHASRS